ncbi:bifunctional oligoribonuclease/PAP phosphatase NrnA [Melioribacteraceae bacterium 4301-Me]|uniref:DHH family phosphoesterase n=1 Tax=Pyranulibacter aquaticus TaxID=3163344 RepID=UPI003596A04B
MDDFQKLKQIIFSNRSFLLTTHINPDADAIGSQLAFYEILRKLNKEVFAVNHSSTPYFLQFLDSNNVIEKFDQQNHSQLFQKVDVIILLDLNQTNRIVKMENYFREFAGIKVCIDHHQDPENAFDYIFGNTEYSATGEIIYDFIKSTKIVELDYNIAVQLYTAIMTDTGSFRFERTTSKVHLIAAELLEYGVNPTEIYDKIYSQNHFSKIKLLGEALKTIQLDDTKQIAYMIITNTDIKNTGADESEVDGFVNFCLSIEGVKIGILFFELKDGIKVSFRSKGKIPVNKLAAEFNGGGHLNASGTRLFNVTIEEYLPKIIKAAQNYL